MKRILALTLAIILVLSCCPSVYAKADGASTDSSTVSNLDPHIKEVLESQLPQEVKDRFVKEVLDSQLTQEVKDRLANTELSDTPMISIQHGPVLFFYIKGNGPKEMISAALEYEKENKSRPYYYILLDTPYKIDHWGKLRGEAERYIMDIVDAGCKICLIFERMM